VPFKSKIKIVHVDDQVKQLEVAKQLLSTFDNVELSAQFTDPIKAKAYIEVNSIDLLILDVEMPGRNGLWLANEIKDKGCLIVFVSAHPEYALLAFEACAVHYILKPITTQAIISIIDRVKKITQQKTDIGELQLQKINELVTNYFNQHSYPRRLFINNLHKTSVLNLSDVLYLVSSGSYTIIKEKTGLKYTASKMLKVYADILENHPDFARIHRSCIVNKNFVKAIMRDKHKIYALMEDDEKLEVSPSLREEIYTILDK
jgi:two-component system, LytTR family, response regulator